MDQRPQNSTTEKLSKEIKAAFVEPLTGYAALDLQRQQWVDYNVLQGVIVQSDGEMQKVTITDFAQQLGVDRTTLYNWTKSIPRFWDLVNERRKEMFDGARTAKVWNALFISATVKLNPQSIAMWLANSGTDFRMPSQPVEHEVGGGLADLMQKMRQRQLGEGNSGNSSDIT